MKTFIFTLIGILMLGGVCSGHPAPPPAPKAPAPTAGMCLPPGLTGEMLKSTPAVNAEPATVVGTTGEDQMVMMVRYEGNGRKFAIGWHLAASADGKYNATALYYDTNPDDEKAPAYLNQQLVNNEQPPKVRPAPTGPCSWRMATGAQS